MTPKNRLAEIRRAHDLGCGRYGPCEVKDVLDEVARLTATIDGAKFALGNFHASSALASQRRAVNQVERILDGEPTASVFADLIAEHRKAAAASALLEVDRLTAALADAKLVIDAQRRYIGRELLKETP